MKKLSVFFIVLVFIFSVNIIMGNFCVNRSSKVFAEENSLEIKSKSAILVDGFSGETLYSKNENQRLPIASMCKIMTLLLTFESINNGEFGYDDKIVISENASSMGGSQVFLEEGGEYIIKDLIKSIVVCSANDSCVAMAEKIAGSEQIFVNMMNNKAKELKMENTVFTNCTGLPKYGQYSSAKDVSIMFRELLKNREYFNFSKIWMDKITHNSGRITEISNTNKLIRFLDGCDSGKTGYTTEAGHCLACSMNKNGFRLISVIISAPDSKTRFDETKQLFNYGYNNYKCVKVVDDHKPFDEKVDVIGGKKDEISIIAKQPFFSLEKNGEKKNYYVEIKPYESVKAPINRGDEIGEISVFENGVEIISIKIVSNEDVVKANYFDNIKTIMQQSSIL